MVVHLAANGEADCDKQSGYSRRSGGLSPFCSFDGRCPYFNNFDASLFKSISLPKSGGLEFRAGAFNLMNTAQFAQPGNTDGFTDPVLIGRNGFSAITYDRNAPRQLRFALKLYYKRVAVVEKRRLSMRTHGEPSSLDARLAARRARLRNRGYLGDRDRSNRRKSI